MNKELSKGATLLLLNILLISVLLILYRQFSQDKSGLFWFALIPWMIGYIGVLMSTIIYLIKRFVSK